MKNGKLRTWLGSAAVLVLGGGLGGALVMMEMDAVGAQTGTARTYGIMLAAGQTTDDCPTTVSAKAIATATADQTWNVTFDSASSNCGSYAIQDKYFALHGGVQTRSGAANNSDFGWMSSVPGHADRSSSLTEVAKCKIRRVTTSENSMANASLWKVDNSDSNAVPFCVQSGTFN